LREPIHLNNTPQIKTLLETTILQATKRQQTHDAWLLDFNAYLQIWGFATDRTLSHLEQLSQNLFVEFGV
jgi:hypothetical protein